MTTNIKDEALKLALEAFEKMGRVMKQSPDTEKAIVAIRKALAEQPAQQQEPVAFYVYKPVLPRGTLGSVSDGGLPWVYDQDPSSGFSARMLVTPYTPASKPWVGLTDKEKKEIYRLSVYVEGAISLTEAKLREKNA